MSLIKNGIPLVSSEKTERGLARIQEKQKESGDKRNAGRRQQATGVTCIKKQSPQRDVARENIIDSTSLAPVTLPTWLTRYDCRDEIIID